MEIERKFLTNLSAQQLIDKQIDGCSFTDTLTLNRTTIMQSDGGYVRLERTQSLTNDIVLHVLTIKGSGLLSRPEYSISITPQQYEEMLVEFDSNIVQTVNKTRYTVLDSSHNLWEIDLFDTGEILAELELDSETQSVKLPQFITLEVTGNPVYYNYKPMETV